MSRILEIAKDLLEAAEIAAADIEMLEPPTIEEQYIMYLGAAISRANKFLDRRKSEIFASVLNLQTMGRVQHATEAYDKVYLLSLGLSLESTSELASELIVLANKYKIPVPRSWTEVSRMNIDLKGEDVPIASRQRPSI